MASLMVTSGQIFEGAHHVGKSEEERSRKMCKVPEVEMCLNHDWCLGGTAQRPGECREWGHGIREEQHREWGDEIREGAWDQALMNLMGHVKDFDFILITKKNCQRVLRWKVTQSGLHFNSITVASRCVYARWYGGLREGRGGGREKGRGKSGNWEII